MARAKVAVPLPATGPMASDLAPRPALPKWADVPLPPPPAPKAAGAAGAAPAAASLPPPPPPLAGDELVAGATTAGAATADAASAGAKTTAAQEFVAAPPGGGALAGAAAIAATPSAQEYSAPGGPGSKEPKVTMAADQTGAMMTVTQDLDSDRLRMEWAKSGGTLPAFEGNLGMIFLYKDLSKDAGAGAYMNGVGISAGLRLALLTLDPPKYATRDTGWTAWKLGVGADVGQTNVTINLPTYRIAGRTYGGPQTATMASTTLIFNLGFMQGFGTFDSPTEWSGMAIGIDWAPSSQKTVMTDKAGNKTESSSFNAKGIALNFESGSLQSMASKMGKKAKIKLSIFLLPPVGDLPLMMSTTLGAVWY